jgi:hypothetical protein
VLLAFIGIIVGGAAAFTNIFAAIRGILALRKAAVSLEFSNPEKRARRVERFLSPVVALSLAGGVVVLFLLVFVVSAQVR